MAPATSYWPPTRSPARSLGLNENGLRHCAQKPSVRPGWPSRERPTAAPQEGQTRLSSGTRGSLRIAFAAPTARADPRAVEASRLDARETVEGESPSPAGDVGTEPARPAAGAPVGALFR